MQGWFFTVCWLRLMLPVSVSAAQLLSRGKYCKIPKLWDWEARAGDEEGLRTIWLLQDPGQSGDAGRRLRQIQAFAGLPGWLPQWTIRGGDGTLVSPVTPSHGGLQPLQVEIFPKTSEHQRTCRGERERGGQTGSEGSLARQLQWGTPETPSAGGNEQSAALVSCCWSRFFDLFHLGTVFLPFDDSHLPFSLFFPSFWEFFILLQ